MAITRKISEAFAKARKNLPTPKASDKSTLMQKALARASDKPPTPKAPVGTGGGLPLPRTRLPETPYFYDPDSEGDAVPQMPLYDDSKVASMPKVDIAELEAKKRLNPTVMPMPTSKQMQDNFLRQFQTMKGTPPPSTPQQTMQGTPPPSIGMPGAPAPFKKGGKVKKASSTKKYASGGSVSTTSRRADGIAQRGKTKCRMV